MYDSEYTGFLPSGFWQRSLPSACTQATCLFYLGSAVGLVYDHRTRPQGTGGAVLPGALRQCNKAINMLLKEAITPMKGQLMLISCIMLVYFESMQERHDAAIQQVLRSRQLLDALVSSCEQVPVLVDIDYLQLLIDGISTCFFVDGIYANSV